MKYISALVAIASLVAAAPEDERVKSLPEMGDFDTYGAFSGYINLADTTKEIHYLFFEAAN